MIIWIVWIMCNKDSVEKHSQVQTSRFSY
jgi:hypothetical protein